ncbi:MAG: methylenetetrahydrofolate--tRNA-(uracil(54)-C(5))-methyltransferase (FADH(2)-oxidizing) TrmFO [Pseudomonadota bacterium]
MTLKPVHIIGGGMAGSEAAWQAANLGVPVIVHEMRGVKGTDAHQTTDLAELVCSNSFRSDDHELNAVGVLHQEMRLGNGLIIPTADQHQVPAGSALAVDREGFAQAVTAKLDAHPLITIVREEVAGLPPEDWDSVIIATGPLTSIPLAEAIGAHTGEEDLAFFDAIAPIVHLDSVDMTKAWRQSRYDKPGPHGDTAAYINCAMDEAQYNAFMDALITGEKTEFKDWEKDTPYFEGCLPIEVMAERGRETLRFGPMKPVGLTNPHNPDVKAHAIVQLRQDNALGTLWNMVGFQTKLKYGAQAEIFRMIPGLETAQFARLGGIHRNTFINSPKLLNNKLQLKSLPRIRFAGQITGVEGYVESAAMGMLAGRFAAADRLGLDITPPPATTALGSLIEHITGGHMDGKKTFQPMNVNFGLFPPADPADVQTKDENGKRLRGKEKGRANKRSQAARALRDIQVWLEGQKTLVPAE